MRQALIVKLFSFLSALTIVVFAWCQAIFSKEWRATIKERMLGGDWASRAKFDPNKIRIWIHAASVGEVSGASPVIKRIKDAYPNVQVFITTTSTTGKAEAIKRGLGQEAYLLPLDSKGLMDQAVKKIAPDLFLLFETELWPNLLLSLARNKAPYSSIIRRETESLVSQTVSIFMLRFLRATLSAS